MEVTTVFIFSSLILILVIGLKLIIISYLKSSERQVQIQCGFRPYIGFGLDTSVYFISLFRVANSINVLMLFDQIGGSFELAKQIAEVFLNFFVGYVPRSAFYCILMVSLIKTILYIILFLIFSRMKFLFSVFCSRSYRNLQLLL